MAKDLRAFRAIADRSTSYPLDAPVKVYVQVGTGAHRILEVESFAIEEKSGMGGRRTFELIIRTEPIKADIRMSKASKDD